MHVAISRTNPWKELCVGNRVTLRPRPQYAGRIWKRSLISPVRPSVHNDPEKLSTENGAFRKCSWKRRNLKTALCVLVWTENILKTELFENDDVMIIRWFVCPSLPPTQIQNGGRNGDCYAHTHGCTQAFLSSVIGAFSNFSGVVWTKKFDAFSEWNLRFRIPPA